MGTKPTDAALLAAQREFNDNTPPVWLLQPTEKVCTACNLVHRGECF